MKYPSLPRLVHCTIGIVVVFSTFPFVLDGLNYLFGTNTPVNGGSYIAMVAYYFYLLFINEHPAFDKMPFSKYRKQMKPNPLKDNPLDKEDE